MYIFKKNLHKLYSVVFGVLHTINMQTDILKYN